VAAVIKRISSENARLLNEYAAMHACSCFAIEALSGTYGFDTGVFSAYIQITKNKTTAAVGAFGDALHLSLNNDADLPELIGFINHLAPHSVTANKSEISDLGEAYTPHRSELLTLVDFKPEQNDAVFYPDNALIYDLISRYLPIGDRELFIADMQSRINHNRAFTCAIIINGKAVSTASALFIGESYALIGAVATDESYRGRGYASSAVSAVCEKLLKENKTPLISCESEATRRIYERIGFIKTDERLTFIKNGE